MTEDDLLLIKALEQYEKVIAEKIKTPPASDHKTPPKRKIKSKYNTYLNVCKNKFFFTF